MNADEHPPQYDVGFRKPPKHTRFKKGLSGNPRGRPKGTRNLATVLEQTLREKVVINENGKRKTVTKLEAAVKQLVNKAASGDLAAMRQLSALAGSSEADSATSQHSSVLQEIDQKVLDRFLRRLRGPATGEDHEYNHE